VTLWLDPNFLRPLSAICDTYLDDGSDLPLAAGFHSPYTTEVSPLLSSRISDPQQVALSQHDPSAACPGATCHTRASPSAPNEAIPITVLTTEGIFPCVDLCIDLKTDEHLHISLLKSKILRIISFEDITLQLPHHMSCVLCDGISVAQAARKIAGEGMRGDVEGGVGI
jgi:hypothetical protein